MGIKSVCVDACLVVALVCDEAVSDQVDALWTLWQTENRRLVAPRVLRFEVVGVLERKMRFGDLDRHMARLSVAAAEFLTAGIEQPEIIGGLPTAWDLAGSYRLRVMDACYLAIARQEDAELWTLDRELAARVGGRIP